MRGCDPAIGGKTTKCKFGECFSPLETEYNFKQQYLWGIIHKSILNNRLRLKNIFTKNPSKFGFCH